MAVPVTAMLPSALALNAALAGLPLMMNWICEIGGAAELGIVAVVVPPGTSKAPTVNDVPVAEPLLEHALTARAVVLERLVDDVPRHDVARVPAGDGLDVIGHRRPQRVTREARDPVGELGVPHERVPVEVGALLRRRDPPLYESHAPLFMGEVPSVPDLYAGALAVLAPAMAGTGTSIKLIEALCAGKRLLTTSLGLRGLPAGELIGADIQVEDTASGFAAALTRLWDGAASAAFSHSALRPP